MAIPDNWVIEALQKRLYWLMARAAIREDGGKDASHDDHEAAALRRALDQFRPDSALEKMKACLDNQQRSAHRQKLTLRQKNARIAQLKKALKDAGIPVPRNEDNKI